MMDPNIEEILDFLAETDWQPPDDPDRDCFSLTLDFRKRLEDGSIAVDSAGWHAFRMLFNAAGLRLVPENPADPFEPVLVIRSSRTSALVDLSDSDVETLRRLASLTTNLQLRARFADIAWVRKRSFPSALLAIDTYSQLADQADSADDWLDAKGYLERAFRIASQLGKGGTERLNLLILKVERFLSNHDDANLDRRLQPWHLMALLLEFSEGDAGGWISLSQQLAKLAESRGEWEVAQNYFDTAAGWSKRNGDAANQERFEILSAALYERIADYYIDRPEPDYLSGSMQLAKAYEAMHRTGNEIESKRLQNRLLKMQKAALPQLTLFQHKLDLTEYVQASMDAVSGKPLPEAILTLAGMVHPFSQERHRDEIARYLRDDPLSMLAGTERINARGRIVGAVPGLVIGDQSSYDAVFHMEMIDRAEWHRSLVVQGQIDPARFQISLEHSISSRDLDGFIFHNPLVPAGREALISRGLKAGFDRDWLVSTHLLIPQIENSLRYAVQSTGVDPVHINDQGIQEEWKLPKLLGSPEVKECFGEEFTFDMHSLLLDRLGPNLRNEFAHGLKDYREFYSVHAVYLWWASLKFFCWPHLLSSEAKPTSTVDISS